MSAIDNLVAADSIELINTATVLIDSFGAVLACNSSFELLVLGKIGRSSKFFALHSFGHSVDEAFKRALDGNFSESKVFIEQKGRLDDWRVVFVPQPQNNVLLIFVGRSHDTAYHDALTGLPNRAVALDRLEHELDRWSRSKKSPFGIALADIDHFKSINDSYGHDIGDQVLKHITDTFTKSLRGGDWVARWGGEEFLFLYHDVEDNAFEACDRSRMEVENTSFVNDDGLRIDVTVSFGVVNVLDEERKTSGRVTVEHMIENTDILLYDAKLEGRNRTMRRVTAEQLNWSAAELEMQFMEKLFLPQRIPLVDESGKLCGNLWELQIEDLSSAAAHHLFLSATRTNMLGKAESRWIEAVIKASSKFPKEQFNLVPVSHNLLERLGDYPEVGKVFKKHGKTGRSLVLAAKHGQVEASQVKDRCSLAQEHGLEFCQWIGSDPVLASNLTGNNQPQYVLIDTKKPPALDVLESFMKIFAINDITLLISEELYKSTSQRGCKVLFIAPAPE